MMAIFRICIAWKYNHLACRTVDLQGLPWAPTAEPGHFPLDSGPGISQCKGAGPTPRRCPMHQQHDPSLVQYPHGRGYGHDYMRGGEVLGGYGYAERDEYAKPRGDLGGDQEADGQSSEARSTPEPRTKPRLVS